MNEKPVSEKLPQDQDTLPTPVPLGRGILPSLSMDGALGTWLTTLLTVVCLVAAYHFLVIKSLPSSDIGTVDIAALIKAKEAQFTDLLSRSNVTDADREAAYKLVSNIGPQIERAVTAVQKQCKCILIVRSAVLAGDNVHDYTKVIMGHLDRNEVK